MIGGFFHPPDSIIYAGIDDPVYQRGRNQQVIDTQAALGFALEAAAAIIEPAENIGFVGVAETKPVR